MNGKINATPVANSIPFDNSSNGFVASDVQSAIEEAKSAGTVNIPEVTSDPISPTTNQTWVLKTPALIGTPIGLLLSLTHDIDSYKLSYKTVSGGIVRVTLT